MVKKSTLITPLMLTFSANLAASNNYQLLKNNQQWLTSAQSQLQKLIHKTTQCSIPNDIINLIDQYAAKRLQQTRLTGHSNRIHRLLFTLNSDRVISSDFGGCIMVWDTHTGQCLRSLSHDQNSANAVTLSPNSQLMAVASMTVGKPCCVREIESNRIIARINPYDQNACITPVAFSPDSQLLAYVQSGTRQLILQNIGSGQRITLPCNIGGPNITFLPRSKLMLMGDGRSRQFWNLITQRLEKTVRSRDIAFSVNRSIYVIFSQMEPCQMALYNTQTHNQILIFKNSHNQYWKVCFDQTGQRIATTSRDSCIRIWDVQSGICIQKDQQPKNIFSNQWAIPLFTHNDDVLFILMKQAVLACNASQQARVFGLRNIKGHILGVSPDCTIVAIEESTTTNTADAQVSLRLFDLFELEQKLERKVQALEQRKQRIVRVKNLLQSLPGIAKYTKLH